MKTLLLLIILPLFASAQFPKEFKNWCQTNQDTIGYKFIIKVDTVNDYLLETSIEVPYNQFNNGYDSQKLFYWKQAEMNQVAAMSGKVKPNITYLYAKPIVKQKTIDYANYKRWLIYLNIKKAP